MPRQQTKTNKQDPLLDTTQSGKHFYLSQCNQPEHTSMSTSLNIAFIKNFKYTFDDYMRHKCYKQYTKTFKMPNLGEENLTAFRYQCKRKYFDIFLPRLMNAFS